MPRFALSILFAVAMPFFAQAMSSDDIRVGDRLQIVGNEVNAFASCLDPQTGKKGFKRGADGSRVAIGSIDDGHTYVVDEMTVLIVGGDDNQPHAVVGRTEVNGEVCEVTFYTLESGRAGKDFPHLSKESTSKRRSE